MPWFEVKLWHAKWLQIMRFMNMLIFYILNRQTPIAFMHMSWIQYKHFSVAFSIFLIVFPFRSRFIILGNGFDTCVHKSSHCKNCCWLLYCCFNCCALSRKKCKIGYGCRCFVSNISKLFLSWLFSLFLSCYPLLF